MALPYQEGFSVSHSKTCTREDIAQLLKHAPPEMRQAVYALFLSAKKSLDLGYHPEVRATPIKGWRCRSPDSSALDMENSSPGEDSMSVRSLASRQW